jgi:hypothetical protein
MKPSITVPLGRTGATPAALELVPRDEMTAALRRHECGDWGDVNAADKAANNAALNTGERLLSSYRTADGTKFWIITEADRSATTVLLPDDY